MASIDIRTTQNVTIEYEMATLRERFFALFIDLLIYYALYILLWFMLLSTVGDAMTQWGFMFLFMLNMMGFVLYHLATEVFSNGQTPGKKSMRIKVVRLDGREPGMGDFLLRSVFLLVDLFLSFGVLGAVMIGSTFKSQRLGDLAANTAVIRVKNQLHFHLADILKIQTLDNYEPKYPAVKQLQEADMLLIKNLVSRFQTWQNDAHATAVHEAVQTICAELKMEPPKGNLLEFLKTLIRDYIVLTR